jgi:hypothetical protein
MDRCLRRIATGVCACVALTGLMASSALAVKPSLLLVASESKNPVAVGAEVEIELRETAVTTVTGTMECRGQLFPGSVTANGGSSIQIELQRAKSQSGCFGAAAMPFASSSYLWGWGNFPFNHSFGEIVMKPKGKLTSSGSAELHPSPSTADDIVFSAAEGGLTRECDYSYKKLTGYWSSGRPAVMHLEKGDKMKLSGSENEASCPKTATIPVEFEVKLKGGGPTEVEVV